MAFTALITKLGNVSILKFGFKFEIFTLLKDYLRHFTWVDKMASWQNVLAPI